MSALSQLKDELRRLEELDAAIEKLEEEIKYELGEIDDDPVGRPEYLTLVTPTCPLGGAQVRYTYGPGDVVPESMRKAEWAPCQICRRVKELDVNGICFDC